MKKRQCKNLQRLQEQLKKIEGDLDRLSQAGLIGESRMIDGVRHWRVEPVHQDFMLDILRHPERWDEVPMFAARKGALMDLRNKAIAKGLINP